MPNPGAEEGRKKIGMGIDCPNETVIMKVAGEGNEGNLKPENEDDEDPQRLGLAG